VANDLTQAIFEIVQEMQKEIRAQTVAMIHFRDFQESHKDEHRMINQRCCERHQTHDKSHSRLYTILVAVFVAILTLTSFVWQGWLTSKVKANDNKPIIKTLPHN